MNACRVNLTRSQSEARIVEMMACQPYVVASWRGGEPICHGFGASAWAARNMARQVDAPSDSELCSRVVGETLVWQGPSGRKVTIEHFLTIDD